MLRVAFYAGLGDSHEVRLIPGGRSYREALPDVDFEHAAIVAGGRFAYPDEEARDGAVVRALPAPPVAVAAVAIIGAAVVTGIGVGVVMYKMKKAQAAQSAAVQAEQQKAVTNYDAGVNLPFQKGATNALATGKSQPYVMGRHGFAPYLLTNKWYELSGANGKDQYVTCALECGFGPLVFEEVRAEEVVLKQFADDLPQEGDGTLVDSAFSRGGTYEIAQDGLPFTALTQMNARVASAASNSSIPYASEISSGSATDLIVSLDPCARDVTLAISFPMGLYATDSSSGNHTAATCRIGAYYSVDGGNSWTGFPFTIPAAGGSSGQGGGQLLFTDRQQVKVATNLRGKDGGLIPGPMGEVGLHTKEVVDNYQSRGYAVVDTEPLVKGSPYYRMTDAMLYTFAKPVYVDTSSGSTSNSFTLNTADEARFEARRGFTWAEASAVRASGGRIYVKLVNESEKDGYVSNAASLLYYESHCYDPERSVAAGDFVDCPLLEEKERSLSAILAVRIKASAANEDKQRKLNVVVRSVARTWDGEAWSEGKSPTSNPAAILLEVLTSPIHPLSRFGDGELDLPAFGGLGEFCEEEGIRFNAVQTAKATKESVLETVCGVCRASLYWNAFGILSVAWDCQQPSPLAILDADSVLSVSVRKEYSRRVDAMRVTYTEADSWEQKAVLVKRSSSVELGADSVIQELTATGPEYLPEVQKYARYLMACMSLRAKVVTVKLGREGMFFTPWMHVQLTDDALGDEPQQLMVSAVRGDGEGWELECVDYSPGIYDTGDVADYESTVREWGDPAGELPVPYVRQGELEEQLARLNGTDSPSAADPDVPTVTASASMDGLSLSLTPGGDGLKNTVKAVTWTIIRPDGSTAIVEDDASAGYAFDRDLDGYPEADDLSLYAVIGRIVNVYGRTAASAPVSVDTSNYGTWIPKVAGLTAQRVTGRTATLSFGQPAGRLLYGEARYKIEVRKKGEATWYDPDLTSDPYSSEDAYKGAVSVDDVASGLNTTHAFTQTLPLDGQNDVIYYESWWYTSKDKKDAYGNPVQQSARTEAFRNAPPHSSALAGEDGALSGTGVSLLGDSDKRPFGVMRVSDWEVYGDITGEGSGEANVCVIRHDGELYEVIPELTVGGASYQIDAGQVTIGGVTYRPEVWNSRATVGGTEYPLSARVWIGGAELDADDVCDENGIFGAVRHSKFFTEEGANPRDTLYEYRSTAYTTDPRTGRVVHRADGLSVFVTALATSAADVVNSAITHNKIAEGAVQVDNLAAGCITADKMAVRDLFAICGVFGRIQDNEITDAANNFWDLETGRFQISNGAKDADGYLTLPESEYFAYTPRGYVQPDGTVAEQGSFWFKIANFVVTSVSSIIRGVFRVQRTNLPDEESPLLEANPTAEADGTTGCPAGTVRVNGTLDASSVGRGIIDAVYPVGSIYMTMADAVPSVLFPGTEWEKVEGRFLLGSSEGRAAGIFGGEESHILTEDEMPSHTHTASQGGGHSHTYSYASTLGGAEGASRADTGFKPGQYINHDDNRQTGSSGAHSHAIGSSGGGQAHNNMPPFLAVNIYRRVA